MKVRALLMIRPRNFGFNPETAASNIFQKINTDILTPSAEAVREFDCMTDSLKNAGIPLLIMDDLPDVVLPDSVFPNNWFSTHPDGIICLYPMLNPSRKSEVRADIVDLLKKDLGYSQVQDFRHTPGICEGTGSLVFDHENRKALAVLSPRTEKNKTEEICSFLGYEPIFLEASSDGKPVYHTNVVLFFAFGIPVVCFEALSPTSRQALTQLYGSRMMEIPLTSMMQFGGNVLAVETHGGGFIIMSRTAWNHLPRETAETLSRMGRMLIVDIPAIEQLGGGSARCMLAEIF